MWRTSGCGGRTSGVWREDVRRVDSVVIEDKVGTQGVVKDETEVGVRRWGKWRLGKTRHKLRKRSSLGTVREDIPRNPFRPTSVCGDLRPTHLETLEALRLEPELVNKEAGLYQG